MTDLVKELRMQYPRWGKEELCILIRERGIESSASTVGRVIGYLKRKGDLVEPRSRCRSGKRRVKMPYAIRKPKDWEVSRPGDLVQIDTFKIAPGLFQYTAVDNCTRYRVLGLYNRGTALSTLLFLENVIEEMPSPIQRIKADRGREILANKVQEQLMNYCIKCRPVKQ